MESLDMMTWFDLAVGAYLLYAAITGKGNLFENEYLKCPKEQYVKTMRFMALFTGLAMAARGGLELAGVVVSGTALGWILWAVVFALILAMMIYSVKKTDRAAASAGKSTQASHPEKPENHDPLRAAFVFDDEDDTQAKEE